MSNRNQEYLDYMYGIGGKPDDMTWSEMGEDFGLTGNAARKAWTRYVERNLAEAKKFGDINFSQEVDDVGETISPTKTATMTTGIYDGELWVGPSEPVVPAGMKIKSKWQVANGDWRYSYEADNTVEQGEEVDLVAAFQRIVSKYESPPVEDNYKIQLNGDVLVVATADKHVGAKIKGDSFLDDLEYGEDTFRKRMMLLGSNIVQRSQKNGGFKELVVFDLGDAVDGFGGTTTRGGHKLPQNMSSEEMFDVYIKVHLDFFDYLIKENVANLYTFVGASNSNHGGCDDYVCMQALNMVLKQRYGNIFEGHVETDFISMITVEAYNKEYNYIYTHGKDKEDRKRGLPFHIDLKTINFVDSMVKYWGLEDSHVSFIKGDLHQAGYEKKPNFDYVNVPSVFGSSDWMINNGFPRAIPGAYFEHISSIGRTTGFIDLNVPDEDTLTPVRGYDAVNVT